MIMHGHAISFKLATVLRKQAWAGKSGRQALAASVWHHVLVIQWFAAAGTSRMELQPLQNALPAVESTATQHLRRVNHELMANQALKVALLTQCTALGSSKRSWGH